MIMRISIIVPVYNVKEYLSKCIDSVLNQTIENMEVILVDDGSTDGSENICDEYADKDLRIRVIHKKNGGLMSAWKCGVKKARGQYIGFVDSDDWIDKHMYKDMLEVADIYEADLVCCGLVWEYPNSNKKYETIKIEAGLYEKADIQNKIYPKLFTSKEFHARALSPNRVTKIFKRTKLMEIIDECTEQISMGEDLITTFLYLNITDRLYIMGNYCPYHYRNNANSMTRHFNEKNYEKIEVLNCELIRINDFYSDYNFSTQIYTDYLNLFIAMMESQILTSDSEFIQVSIRTAFSRNRMRIAQENCDKEILSLKNRICLLFLKLKLEKLLIWARRKI